MAEGQLRASLSLWALQWAKMAASMSQTTTLCAASPEANTAAAGQQAPAKHTQPEHAHPQPSSLPYRAS